MADRSSRAEVRNPLLALPAMEALRALPQKHLLIALLEEIRAHAREQAEKSWRTHKAPMAFYWKVVSVYVGHIIRALKRPLPAPAADSCTCQRYPTHCANDCPIHGLDDAEEWPQ